MDNNELDQKLKNKLNNQIKPPKEFEEKILKTIQEQQFKAEKSKFEKINNLKETKNNKTRFNNWSKRLISVAAMFIVIFTAGIIYNKSEVFTDNAIQTVTIKAIEPTKLQSGILAENSEFLVYTEEDNASVESVKKSLYIEPALEYEITQTNNKNEYKVTFKQNIPDNTIVKLQYIKNQIIEESWAYQTNNKLSVTKTYPVDKSNTVSTNTIISIELSYANVENFENNVKITPEVKGKWEHKGKIWNFIPEKALSKNSTYKVIVNKGIKADDQILESIYSFTFGTYEDELNTGMYNQISNTFDEINTFKSNEQVKIYYNTDRTLNSKNDSVKKIELNKFNSEDDFINYLITKNYENVTSKGNVEFQKFENSIVNESDYYKYIVLNKTLSNGYYVASIQDSNNKELFNCPIQINDLSVYALETERDVLAWVAEDGKLANNITVEYKDKQEKTNKDGIATFKDATDGKKDIKYMKVGNTENKLIVGICNFDQQVYPNSYIYTDRPLYKTNDTINVWGFIPLKEYYDNIEDEFTIQLGNEEKQKVTVEKDGNLNYKIELNNHIESTPLIKLYYKDIEIAYKEIEIKNYELQNYNYEIKMDKNYVYNGEKIEFDVEVSHITGIKVANKSIIVKFSEEEHYAKTDENGIAHFSLSANYEEDLNDNPIIYKKIEVYNGDVEEYTNAETLTDIYILLRNVASEIKETKTNFEITLHTLINNKNSIINKQEDLYENIYNTTVELNLIESVRTRVEDGYQYDEYSKENEPVYKYETSENVTKIKDIKTKDGKFEYDYSQLTFKKNSLEKEYSYYIEIKYKDSNGKEINDYFYVINNNDISYQNTLGLYFNNINGEDIYSYGNINESRYNTYRYLLENTNENDNEIYKFSINDVLNFKLKESTINGLEERSNEGTILRVVFKEGITSKDLIQSNDLNYKFSDKDFPGCKLTSAYFKDGKFYRMPIYFFDFNEEVRKVDVEIKSDKEQYKPGDEVTLTINTKNNNKPIKTSVNVSVVNEAVFNLVENDLTNIQEEIYRNKNLVAYTYSSFNDFLYQLPADGSSGKRRKQNKIW